MRQAIHQLSSLLALGLLSLGLNACDGESTPKERAEATRESQSFAQRTTALCEGTSGDLIGYQEANNPDYGIREYTLWAGKHNDAGTVTVTYDDESIYVTYNTNGAADLGEVHVYVWTDEADLPTRRPAPGHAHVVASGLNADSYTVVYPAAISCGQAFWISTHAALVANQTADDEPASGDLSGETAYAGDRDEPACYDAQAGSWWGVLKSQVECFYNLEGLTYRDFNHSYDREEGEESLHGLTVTLMSAEGEVIATQTSDEEGEFLFEHLPAGAGYSVSVSAPEGDFMPTENHPSWSIDELVEDVSGVDFGFAPLFDVDVEVSFEGGCSGDVEVSFGEGSASLNGAGQVSFEDLLSGDYPLSVTTNAKVESSSMSQVVTVDEDKNISVTFICVYDVVVNVGFEGDCSGDVNVTFGAETASKPGAGSVVFQELISGDYPCAVSTNAPVESSMVSQVVTVDEDKSLNVTFVCLPSPPPECTNPNGCEPPPPPPECADPNGCEPPPPPPECTDPNGCEPPPPPPECTDPNGCGEIDNPTLGSCETAFAYDGDGLGDFLQLDLNLDGRGDFNRWGWVIGPFVESSSTYTIYAGAGQSDITKGTLVGMLTVTYEAGVATVKYEIDSEFAMTEAQVYVGAEMLPRAGNGAFTVAPGAYTSVNEFEGALNTFTVQLPTSGAVYLIAHSTVCER